MPSLEIMKDITVAIAAIVTSTVAVKGLNKWHNEIQGKADFEAARALISATIKLRDEIELCRSPFIRAGEFPDGYLESRSESSSKEDAQAYTYMFSNRLRPVIEALREFDSKALEGEVLWGENCHTATEALRRCVAELNTAIKETITDKAAGGEHFSSNPGFAANMYSITTLSGVEENAFSNRVKSAVEGITKEIRPYLRKHS
jgi:hypothetical protein